MSDLHETSLKDSLAVDGERRESERANGVPESYSAWPRDLLVRWRSALAQLRLVRSVTRQQGKQPPSVTAELSWVDAGMNDNWFRRGRALPADLSSSVLHAWHSPFIGEVPIYAASHPVHVHPPPNGTLHHGDQPDAPRSADRLE